jgi:condensin complex subunit 3
MPPKKNTKKSTTAAAAHADRPRTFREIVLESLDKAHRTAGNMAAVKKLLVSHSREGRLDEVASVFAEITRTVFSQAPQLAPDALRRHNLFLKETCDEVRIALGGCDDVSCAGLEEVAAAGHAQDKAVRLAVALSCSVLIKTLNPQISNDARMTLYDKIALLLKHWMFDKCHLIREKAIETITVFRAKDDLSTCDVTPLLLAASAEDTNPSARRAAVACSLDKSAYFFDVSRATRDVSAKVRQAAWESLGRFKLSHAASYHSKYIEFLSLREIPAEQLPGDFTARIGLGLQDDSASVRKAAKLTLTHTWLHREFQNDVESVLALLPYNKKFSPVVAQELYNHRAQRVAEAASSSSSATTRGFPLKLSPLTVSGLLLWRVSCVDSVECASDETDHILLSVKAYSEVLFDVVQILCDTTGNYRPKIVTMGETADPECVLEILLSLLPVYASAGYLAHTESAVRSQLIKQLSYILRVIPNSDVAAFVSDSVVGINALCARDPTDGREAIATSIAKLSKFLSFVDKQQASFDDPVGYAKRDEERRWNHVRAMHRGHLTPEDEARRDAMDLDKNFLHRMLKIVHEYLSQAQRGDAIPAVCAQVTALSRSQTDDSVRAAAVRCLALQCLINPEMVHTFLPLLMDATSDQSPACAAAAMGAVFDLLCEFGLRFFDIGACGSHDGPAAAAQGVDGRRKLEQTIAQQDVHKIGGPKLVSLLLPFLRSEVEPCKMVATAGFCKLLAANRLDHPLAVTVLADVLATSASDSRKTSHLAAVVDTFAASYSRSQPARLFRVAEAGVIAFRILLATNPTADALLTSFLSRLVQLTDASLLRSLQELDPEYTTRIQRDYAEAQEQEQQGHDEDGGGPKTSKGSLRHPAAGNARIQRELDANSVHEYLMLEFLLECCVPNQPPSVQGVCIGVLRRLFLYRRDETVKNIILSLGDRCMEALTLAEHRETLRQCLRDYRRLAEGSNNSGTVSLLGNPLPDMLRPLLLMAFEDRLSSRAVHIAEMTSRGFNAAVIMPPDATTVARVTGSRSVTQRADEDPFDTETLAQQPRRKASRRE